MEIEQTENLQLPPKKRKEIVYINWMRSFAIYGVIYAHTLVALNRSYTTYD